MKYFIFTEQNMVSNSGFWKLIDSARNTPVLSKLLFWGIKYADEHKRKYVIIENCFLIICIILYLFEIVLHLYLHIYYLGYVYLGLTIVTCVSFFAPIGYKKFFKVIVYIVMISLIYFHSQLGVNKIAFTELLYIPVALSSVVTFNLPDDKNYILLVLILVVIFFSINFFEKFHRYNVENIYNRPYQAIISHFSLFIISTIFNLYFISLKYRLENYIKLKEMEAKINDAFEELILLAKSNSPEYLVRFKEVYPDFFNKLIGEYPQLNNSEIKLCTYIKLNFTTKEISNYTFRSIRSIESSKYRLRKKISLPSEIDLNIWFIDF